MNTQEHSAKSAVVDNGKLSAFYNIIRETTTKLVECNLIGDKDDNNETHTSPCVSKVELAGELVKTFLKQLESIVPDEEFLLKTDENDPSSDEIETRHMIESMIEKLQISHHNSSNKPPSSTPPPPPLSLGAQAVCPQERRKTHEPDLLTEEEILLDTREGSSESDVLPSASYLPKRPRSVQNGIPDTQWDVGDEFRDDDDPGYRIRDVYEADLLSELQLKLRQPVVYQSLFNPPLRLASEEQIRHAAAVVKKFSRKCARIERQKRRLNQQQLQQSSSAVNNLNKDVEANPGRTNVLVNDSAVRSSPPKIVHFNNITNKDNIENNLNQLNVELGEEVNIDPLSNRDSMASSRLIEELQNAQNLGNDNLVRGDESQTSNDDQNRLALTMNPNFDSNGVEETVHAVTLHQNADDSKVDHLLENSPHNEHESSSYEQHYQKDLVNKVEDDDGNEVIQSDKPKINNSNNHNFVSGGSGEGNYNNVLLSEDEDLSDFNDEDAELEAMIRAGGGSITNTNTPGTILDPSTGQCVLITDTAFRQYQKKVALAASHWAQEFAGGSVSVHKENKRKARAAWLSKVNGCLRQPRSSDPSFPLKVRQQQQGVVHNTNTTTATTNTTTGAATSNNNSSSNNATTTLDCFHLRVVFDRDRTGFEDHKELNPKIGELIAGRYVMAGHLGSAAFSKAVKCVDEWTGRLVCMKIIKNEKEFFDQSIDEIKLLRYINANCDPDECHVLRLLDFFYHREHLIIVTELLRDNLYEYSKFIREQNLLANGIQSPATHATKPYFTLGRLQKVTKQVLQALRFTHSLRLVHCDLKPENILLKRYKKCEVKVIDFGSSCFDDDHMSSYVQSRSYRAPEVILGLPYDSKVDIWSLGCIIAELWAGYVLFQNDSIVSLLARVTGILGPFPSYMLTRGRYVPQYFTQDGQLYAELDEPFCSERGRRVRLLVPKRTTLWQRMRTDDRNFLAFLHDALQLDPSRRPSATQLLGHPWLTESEYSDGLTIGERRALHQMHLKDSLLLGSASGTLNRMMHTQQNQQQQQQQQQQ